MALTMYLYYLKYKSYAYFEMKYFISNFSVTLLIIIFKVVTYNRAYWNIRYPWMSTSLNLYIFLHH